MNAKIAKRLRRLARLEMSANKETVDRDLVVARINGHDRVINEPMSVRSFYLALKTSYADYKRGVALKQQAVDE